MQHIFDVDVAVKYGMDVATFIKNISFWVVKNQSNNEHFHDGRYWTYNKLDAFTLIFPYWSKDQIRRIIVKCVNHDLIVKGNYNKSGYDQTLWYSLSDFGHKLLNIDIIPDRHRDVAKSPDRRGETPTPIPYINTDNKPYIKDKDKAQPKKPVACEIELPDWLPKETWEEFKQHRKEMKKPMSTLAQKKTIAQLDKMRVNGQDIVSVINQSIANGWQGIFELKSQGSGYGNNGAVVGPNGYIEPKRTWSTEVWDILKEGCGFSRDADLSKIKGLIPGQVWDDLPDPRRDYDSRPTLDYDAERDS